MCFTHYVIPNLIMNPESPLLNIFNKSGFPLSWE